MSNRIQQIFARNVRYFRKQLKLTQSQLAQIIECTASFIGYIEAGKTSVSLDTIEALSIAFQIQPAELFSQKVREGVADVSENTPLYPADMVGMISDLTRVIDRHKDDLSPLYEKIKEDKLHYEQVKDAKKKNKR